MNPAPGFKSSAGLARALALQHSPRPVWGREGRVSGSPDEFDLDAAFLRRSEGDLRAFMEALAVRLEGAAPGRIRVDRRKDGLLSKTSHVAKIAFQGERGLYELDNDRGRVGAKRAKLVRGVVISSAVISVEEWLTEVKAEVKALAEQAGSSSDTLHGFL